MVFNSIRILLYAATSGMAICFLWHFSNILRFGQHFIQEPSLIKLIAEITLIVLVLITAIALLIIDFKRLRKMEKRDPIDNGIITWGLSI